VDRLEAKEGESHTLDRVLFVANEGQFQVGSPTIAKATIVVDIVEHFRGDKKIAFKMKRRKGYHRTVGHRQEMTRIKVGEIKV
jgi:large subunit ribosomal protein L21